MLCDCREHQTHSAGSELDVQQQLGGRETDAGAICH